MEAHSISPRLDPLVCGTFGMISAVWLQTFFFTLNVSLRGAGQVTEKDRGQLQPDQENGALHF